MAEYSWNFFKGISRQYIMGHFIKLPMLSERELNEISRLLEKAYSIGFADVHSYNELIESILNLQEGDIYAVLHRPNKLPVLVNAGLEEGYVSIALLDLNLTLTLPIVEYPELRDFFSTLENVTTRLGFERHGDRAIAPFLYPLALYENEGLVSVVVGIKSAVHVSLFNESYLEGLLEDLLLNYEKYFKEIAEDLKRIRGRG